MTDILLKTSLLISETLFIVELSHMKVPNVINPQGVTCKLISFDGTTELLISNTQDLSVGSQPKYFLSSSINIFDSYPLPGLVSRVQIKVYLESSGINSTDSFYVVFPSYFDPSLGYDNLYCSYNSIRVSCSVYDEYTLRITDFPSSIPKLTIMVISVYGIIFPSVPSTSTEKYYLAYDNDDDPSEVIQHGTIPKLNSRSYPSAFNPEYTVEESFIRVTTSYKVLIDASVLAQTISSGSIIIFNFPDAFSSIIYD